ncbi:MAG TPA: radical SAM protein, partial [Pirellula sp.]|nr:radical SAM protein [Pirellula sp.]
MSNLLLNQLAQTSARSVLFVQLPIPPAGPAPIYGNVPLAAGYLMLHARSRGLEEHFRFEILSPKICNYHSDLGIVEQILVREPRIVGFSCYLWNIDRSLWIAAQLKRLRPEMIIVLGGPEITNDNAWVFASGVIDYAAIGEGEQTFSDLLEAILDGEEDRRMIPGLWRATHPQIPLFRKPIANLDDVSSPYLHGILNAADEGMLLLETIRGCVFKCKFCYYPKSYDSLYFVSEEKIIANLKHARDAGATEVVLLDPTLNQRRDFDGFLRLLARENHDQQFTYFGELRAEGIKPETAKLLRAANFTEVEIGLQSIDPTTQDLMDRRNNLKAFERGVTALMDAGIRVKVDLIIGLPGDTVASVRRGFEYLSTNKLFTSTQVFNLAILPGTAFRS